MKYIILSITLLIIANINLHSQEMKTYIDKTYNFNIQYPDTWKELDNPSTVCLFIRPLEKEGQLFRENINLIIDKSQGFELKEYVGATKMQFQTQLKDYNHVSTDYIKFSDIEFGQVIYQHNLSSLSLQGVYYVCIIKGKAYNFTCSTTQQNFKKYYPLFEEMIKSFSLND